MSKYLELTMHDSDFTSYAYFMGEAIYNICYVEDQYFTEEDIPTIKKYIEHLWYAYHNLVFVCRFGHSLAGHRETFLETFDVDVSIVDDEYIENERRKNSYSDHDKLYIKLEDCENIQDVIGDYVFVL